MIIIIFLGGAKYFVLIIDDYSKRLWVYLFKKNFNMFLSFKEFEEQVQPET